MLLTITELAERVERDRLNVWRQIKRTPARFGAVKLGRDWHVPATAPDGSPWTPATWRQLVPLGQPRKKP